MGGPSPSPSPPAPAAGGRIPDDPPDGPRVGPPDGRTLTGAVLGARYELRALVGRGGMGEVYEAADPVLDRTVAVKVLRPELAADRRSAARFEREARTAARLSHPRIVAVFDAGRHEDRVFIVMEHVAGSTLVDALARRGTLDPATGAAIGADVADALAHAHERGVVHRDVTPGNVMLDRDGRAKVLDFGIARAALGSLATGSASLHGTLAYTAPEVLAGVTGDQRVDAYGLGAVLYELLTGAPPFRGDDADVRKRLAVRRPVPVRAWAPEVPAELDELVAELLAFDPDDRPGDLRTVSRRLRGLADSPIWVATAPLVVPVALGVPTGDERPTTPPLVPPTEVLASASAAAGPTTPPATEQPRPRRWRRRLGRAAAWVALVVALASAAAVLVPSIAGLSDPVRTRVVPPPALAAPAEIAVTTSCDGWLSTAADVTWSPVAGATGYEIWRRGTGDERSALVAETPAGVLALRDTELGLDTTYTYRVRAIDAGSVGEWSAARTAATPLLCVT